MRVGSTFSFTVKPLKNDHPRHTKIVSVVDRWSLFRGTFISHKLEMGLVVALDKWSFLTVYLIFQVWRLHANVDGSGH